MRASGGASALAVIVRLEGSAYRRPGAKVLVRDDGGMMGNVSGGCLENDVREVALKAIGDGRTVLAHYDTSGNEDRIWGLGVGCNGKVDVLVVPCSGWPAGILERLQALLEGDRPFALSWVVDGSARAGAMLVAEEDGRVTGTSGDATVDGIMAGQAAAPLRERRSRACERDGVRFFTEVLVPPPHLVVCGAGDDAVPLVSLAAEAGFRVTVIDHRDAYLPPERFPDAVGRIQARPGEEAERIPSGDNTYAVVKAHLLDQDRGWVEWFAARSVPYIGLLGSRARREEITAGLTAEQRARVYGPVGLDLGAEGPGQIAVSVVAEVMAVCSGRTPGHLRDRQKGLHEKG